MAAPRAELTPDDLSAALKPLLELQAAMQQQQAALQQQQAATLASALRTEARLGHIFEAAVRAGVADRFGREYAEPAQISSLLEAASLLPLGVVAPQDAAERGSRALVTAAVPLELLLRCERVAALRAAKRGAEAPTRFAAAGPWLDADGSVRVAEMEAGLSASGDAALAILARKLREAVGKPPEAQAAFLLSRGGPGVACLLAASLPPGLLFDEYLPGESFQLDAIGRREFREGGAVLAAEVGEIQAGMDYAKAVPQLGRALCALSWMASTCCRCDSSRAALVGRLFVPRSQVDATAADVQQMELALSQYGYQLHLHAL